MSHLNRERIANFLLALTDSAWSFFKDCNCLQVAKSLVLLTSNCINARESIFPPFTNTVYEHVRLKSLIDVLICKLHYGFGGNRLPTLSKQASFFMFSLNSNNLYVQKLDRMRMID